MFVAGQYRSFASESNDAEIIKLYTSASVATSC